MQKRLTFWRAKLQSKGFVLTLEATVTIIIFTMLIFALPIQQAHSTKELALTQQANDLLRVWSASDYIESEMIKDTKEMFGNSAELWINGTKVLAGEKKSQSIASEGIILDNMLMEIRVRVVVYYN